MSANYWLELGMPSILFAFAFIAMIWGLCKGYFQKPIWVYALIAMMIIFLIGANAIRYIGVELVRAGQIGALDAINAVMGANIYILGAISLIILFFNRTPWAALPMITVLTFSAIMRYSIWLVNLTIWYAQGYF